MGRLSVSLSIEFHKSPVCEFALTKFNNRPVTPYNFLLVFVKYNNPADFLRAQNHKSGGPNKEDFV